MDQNFESVKRIEKDEIALDISRSNLEIVNEGMYRVVQGNGTARHIQNSKFTIAGKTGTVQNPHGEDHSLFTGFAPFENPEIVVVVMVENAGSGSSFAAPLAGEIFKKFFSSKSDRRIAGKTN